MALMMESYKNQKFSESINLAFNDGNPDKAIELFSNLHTGAQPEVFLLLTDDNQANLLDLLNTEVVADIFDRLDDDETLEAASDLSVARLAEILDEMQPDEAADLLGDLPDELASQALENMEDIHDVLPLLEYSDETAGGRMTTSFMAMRNNTTCDEAIHYLRQVSPDDEDQNYIFVTNKNAQLAGLVSLRQLVVSGPDITLQEIMDPNVIHIEAQQDQEIVAQIMQQYDLSLLPVIDQSRKLIGVITHDDILDVLTEEATEDIYRLASVLNNELEPESPVKEHLKGRLPWLYLNTVTALFASWVISNYEHLFATVAALAVFQSVVAGQGGNAASQSVAMIVRSLALGKLTAKNYWKILARQIQVGLVQGIAVGVVVGVGVGLWQQSPYLGLILGLALVGNMIIAGIIGTIIPLGLHYIGQDPALASTVLVTAATDSLGFFIFLSLASIFINNLK